MNKMQEVIDTIDAISGTYYSIENETWRSPKHKWDRIICKVCIGCGQKLSQYENKLPFAFCFDCRDVLFPETVTAKEAWQKKHRDF